MRTGTRRRAGRAVLALLAGLLAGAWAGGGLVWVFNRSKLSEAAGVSLAPADELDLVPADGPGFVHVRAADLWKTEAAAPYRELIAAAGDDALRAFDDGFAPAPSALDRVTVVAVAGPAAAGPPPGDPGPKGKAAPPPAPPDLDAVVVATFSAPFDLARVRNAVMPGDGGNKQMVGEFEMWANSGAAVAARGDRTLVLGSPPAVRALLSKPKTPDGPLAPALKLAAAGGRHVVAGLNLKAYPLPVGVTREVPPEAGALLRADALAAGLVVGRGAKLDFRAAYKDEATAGEAEAALRKAAEAARKALDGPRAKAREAAAGAGPKPRPLADLPAGAGGLAALGALGRADRWLADPRLERAGSEVVATVAVDSAGGVYTGVAAVAAGLLLPAAQKAQAAAGRAGDAANLVRIAKALHDYEAATGGLPAAGLTDPPNNPRGRPLLSWRVAVLPYLGEQSLYDEFNHDEPWDSPDNRKLLPRMPAVFAAPGAAAPPGKTHYRVFVGPDAGPARTMFGRAVGRRLGNIPDGTSNTIMVAEATDPTDWTRPDELPFGPAVVPRLGLPGAAGFTAAMGDGSTRYFPNTTRTETLRILIGADDGLPVPTE